MDSPQKGLKLFVSPDKPTADIYAYASRMWYTADSKSLMVIRLAFLFDLITFSSYSATAVLFAVISFMGGWVLFNTFYNYTPKNGNWIALATLFLPSVVFWGSGLLKDTLTLAFLGFATYSCNHLFIQRKWRILEILLLLVSLYALFSLRKFVLQAFLPAAILWILAHRLGKIKSSMSKILLVPLISLVTILLSMYAIVAVGKNDKQYSIEMLSETARTTAYDIRFWTGKDAGSGYYLGELDGSFQSLLELAPQAINVTLFRPYLWEIKNPLMVMSAVESFFIFLATIYFLYRNRSQLAIVFKSPMILFCFSFSISFAFAVGVSTFNFGTLARYKISAIPFFLLGLVMLDGQRPNKTANADET